MSDEHQGLRAQLMTAALANGAPIDAALDKARQAFAWVTTGSALLMLPAPAIEAVVLPPAGAVAEMLAARKPKRQGKKSNGGTAPAKRGGPRASIDEAKLRKLWASDKTAAEIAEALGISGPTLKKRADELGLPARGRKKSAAVSDEDPPAIEPAPEEDTGPRTVDPADVAKFLTECGEQVKPLGATKWTIGNRTVDRIGLLDHANVMRRRMKQSPFNYAGIRN